MKRGATHNTNSRPWEVSGKFANGVALFLATGGGAIGMAGIQGQVVFSVSKAGALSAKYDTYMGKRQKPEALDEK